MQVISKNCSKKQSKQKTRKSMAVLGTAAYISSKPKMNIEAVPAKKQ